MSAEMPSKLSQAAQDVVDRWDTPLWKDTPATAHYIDRLRGALAAERACILCGASKPCMTEKDLKPEDPGVPCTFDPTPHELFDDNKRLRLALEQARNGLQWYQDRYPEAVDGSDDEAMTEIDAALAGPESVTCLRCGHENWIQSGKAPCQVHPPSLLLPQESAEHDPLKDKRDDK